MLYEVITGPEVHITGDTMGTYYSIKVADGVVKDQTAFQAEVDRRLERVNNQMSTYRPKSELVITSYSIHYTKLYDHQPACQLYHPRLLKIGEIYCAGE